MCQLCEWWGCKPNFSFLTHHTCPPLLGKILPPRHYCMLYLFYYSSPSRISWMWGMSWESSLGLDNEHFRKYWLGVWLFAPVLSVNVMSSWENLVSLLAENLWQRSSSASKSRTSVKPACTNAKYHELHYGIYRNYVRSWFSRHESPTIFFL